MGCVAGIELTIGHAALRLAAVPLGRRVSVTNEPSWTAAMTGHAIVGAAFLSGAEFLSMLEVVPEPGLSCAGLAQSKSAKVTLTFYTDDHLIRSRIDMPDVSFSD